MTGSAHWRKVRAVMHVAGGMWSNFRFALLAVLAFGTIAIIVGQKMIATPQRIKDAVSEGVTGFECPALSVEEPGGSWNSHSSTMRAALWLPQACAADLQHRIQSSSLFVADRCNRVDQCWVRQTDHKLYSFTFYPDYVGFRFEER